MDEREKCLKIIVYVFNLTMEGNINFVEREQLRQLFNFYGENGNLFKAGLLRLFEAVKYTPTDDQKKYIDKIFSTKEYMFFEGILTEYRFHEILLT